MAWNWQQDDWPQFRWDVRRLVRAEALFAEGAGVVIGASRHLDSDQQRGLTVELMSDEAVDTSAIEGEVLDSDSVQSSIRRQLGFASDHRRVKPEEAGVAALMIDIYQEVTAPLTDHVLHRWHRMIMNGRTDLRTIGAYRTHDEPMQIVSGPVHAPKVHFEAPASTRLPAEMAAYWKWLDVSGPKCDAPAAPVSRAGVAHIWFESIHPYEDGNGRLGRAISEKVLAQGFPTPAVTGMASTLLRHRKAYYAQLERAHSDLDVTDWLLWFAAKAIEAQRRTLQKLEFVLEKSRLMDRLRGRLNPRQEKALLRLFAAGPDGFAGGLSAANYMSITGASSATTTRDLTALVAMSALTRTGGHRSTRYRLNIEIEPLRSVEVSDIL